MPTRMTETGIPFPLDELDVQQNIIGLEGRQLRERAAECIRKVYNELNREEAAIRNKMKSREEITRAFQYGADKVKKISPVGVAARGAATYLGYSLGYAALGLGCLGLGYGIGTLIDKKIIKPLERRHEQKVKDELQSLRPMH